MSEILGRESERVGFETRRAKRPFDTLRVTTKARYRLNLGKPGGAFAFLGQMGTGVR